MNLNATTVIAVVGVLLCLTRKSKHRQNVCCLREFYGQSISTVISGRSPVLESSVSVLLSALVIFTTRQTPEILDVGVELPEWRATPDL